MQKKHISAVKEQLNRYYIIVKNNDCEEAEKMRIELDDIDLVSLFEIKRWSAAYYEILNDNRVNLCLILKKYLSEFELKIGELHYRISWKNLIKRNIDKPLIEPLDDNLWLYRTRLLPSDSQEGIVLNYRKDVEKRGNLIHEETEELIDYIFWKKPISVKGQLRFKYLMIKNYEPKIAENILNELTLFEWIETESSRGVLEASFAFYRNDIQDLELNFKGNIYNVEHNGILIKNSKFPDINDNEFDNNVGAPKYNSVLSDSERKELLDYRMKQPTSVFWQLRKAYLEVKIISPKIAGEIMAEISLIDKSEIESLKWILKICAIFKRHYPKYPFKMNYENDSYSIAQSWSIYKNNHHYEHPIHSSVSPLVGKTISLIWGKTMTVEDWADRLFWTPYRKIDNDIVKDYIKREQSESYPNDNDVIWGQVDGLLYLAHVSEIRADMPSVKHSDCDDFNTFHNQYSELEREGYLYVWNDVLSSNDYLNYGKQNSLFGFFSAVWHDKYWYVDWIVPQIAISLIESNSWDLKTLTAYDLNTRKKLEWNAIFIKSYTKGIATLRRKNLFVVTYTEHTRKELSMIDDLQNLLKKLFEARLPPGSFRYDYDTYSMPRGYELSDMKNTLKYIYRILWAEQKYISSNQEGEHDIIRKEIVAKSTLLLLSIMRRI